MRNISTAELLTAWEQAYHLPDIDKGLLFLNLCAPHLSPDECAGLSIGNRDAALLLLREKVFGPKMLNTVVCKACGSKLEWEGSTSGLLVKNPDLEPATNIFDLKQDEFLVRFRLPHSNDIAYALGQDKEDISEKLMVTSCVTEARKDGRPVRPAELPDSILEKISDKMEDLDPQANISINLKCPECENEWSSQFDILSYFWSEINHWAVNMLQDVDTLAGEYGWTEKEIFELSDFRRQTYITIINS